MSATLARAVLVVAACAASLAAQSEAPARRGEGQLDNDSFLFTDARAQNALALADRRYGELLAKAPAAPDARAWIEVLDGWHTALRDSSVGAMVAPRPIDAVRAGTSPWGDPDGTADSALDRRRDGVEVAVLRRLALAPEFVRALWIERFDALAAAALARAPRDLDNLRAVERAFPATGAAVRAAVALAESELERARPEFALAWLARARAQLALGAAGDSAALERRAELARAELGVRPVLEHPWEGALGLEPVAAILIDDAELSRTPRAPTPGLGLRSGMCFLERDWAVIELPGERFPSEDVSERLALVDLAAGTRIANARMKSLLDPLGVATGFASRPVEPPGWPLAPASDGRVVVATVGRRTWERSNALVCFAFEHAPESATPPLPRVHWVWSGATRIEADGTRHEPATSVWSAVEFQPGALIYADTVFAVARDFGAAGVDGPPDDPRPRTGTEIRTWLAAFDLASGQLVWRVELGRGFEIERGRERFFSPSVPTASAQALAEIDGRIFVGSHTGFGCLVDAVDGRIAYGLRCRRRDPERRSWTGARPPVDRAGAVLLWAPADSDQLYWLRAAPDLDGRGVFVHPPRAIGEGRILIGGGAREALVLGRAGPERALTSWNPTTGRTFSAPYLGPAEDFAGEGLASPTRAMFATTRGVLLCDRTRELFLLDYATLRTLRGPAAELTTRDGSLTAHGEWVCVLGATTLSILRVER